MTPVLGVRIKSGWAATVLLGGTREQPVVLDARKLDLADPDTPGTLQPYHAGAGRPQRDARVLRERIGLIERCARANAAALINDHRAAGHAVRRAVLVGTSETDPATISNPHIRTHALEGQLFRRVAEASLVAAGLHCSVVLERRLLLAAPGQLDRSAKALARALAGLRPAGRGPWRHEQKMAALAAWESLESS